LTAGLFLVVPIVLVLFDLAVIVMGVQINDSTCREAARMASKGDPTSSTNRATAVINRANNQGSSMLSQFYLISCNNTVTAADVTALQPFGGPVNGTVTVITEVDIRPFVVALVYQGGGPMKFRSSQTYPVTFVVPNTAGGP
jgi:hypothetical protein